MVNKKPVFLYYVINDNSSVFTTFTLLEKPSFYGSNKTVADISLEGKS